MLAIWLHLVGSDKYPITTVDQKFMVVGHSYLPNDRDFSSIEPKAQHIYVPGDWTALIQHARQKNPFHVTEMSTSDFMSFKAIAKAFVNRKKNTQGQQVDLMSIRWIRVSKDKPLQYSYRYSLNDLEAWKDRHITFKELLPIVVATAIWGPQWYNKSVRCLCDNEAVVHIIINTGTSKHPAIMSLMRCLYFITAKHNTLICCPPSRCL